MSAERSQELNASERRELEALRLFKSILLRELPLEIDRLTQAIERIDQARLDIAKR